MSDYHRLDKANRYLALSGAPVTILSNRSRDELGFKAIISPTLKLPISPQDQELVYNSLVSGEVALGEPSLILIGAETALSGQKMAANIAAAYIDGTPDPFPFVRWFNLGYHDFDFLKNHRSTNGVVVIPGLDKDSDPKRLTLAKDYMAVTQGSTILIVVETPDIWSYNYNVLHLQPDIVMQLGKIVKTRTRI